MNKRKKNKKQKKKAILEPRKNVFLNLILYEGEINLKKVITYGTFDLFHVGHVNILKRAKEKGDYLIVGLSTDEFNKIKGKHSIIPYKQRKEILEAIKYVDEVIPENSWEQKKEDIKKYKIDILVMGNDWEGKFDFLKELCEVEYLERTPDVSSTEIKRVLNKISQISFEDLKRALDILSKIDYKELGEAMNILKDIRNNLL